MLTQSTPHYDRMAAPKAGRGPVLLGGEERAVSSQPPLPQKQTENTA